MIINEQMARNADFKTWIKAADLAALVRPSIQSAIQADIKLKGIEYRGFKTAWWADDIEHFEAIFVITQYVGRGAIQYKFNYNLYYTEQANIFVARIWNACAEIIREHFKDLLHEES